jgi:DNA polymerase III sliding clamp (beta) subunit (PCNA family)
MQFIVENEKFANALGLAKGCIRASTIPILAHISPCRR